ncbi:MAG: ABC transporter permease [Rhodanobacter sp.]
MPDLSQIPPPSRRSSWSLPMPWQIFRPLRHHRYLLQQLVQKEIYGRYRRSRFGLLWILGQPLLLLLGYTLVFGVFLKARWGGAGNSSEFALVLFSGLIFYNFFAEVISRSTGLINGNISFVKKMVFPLETLNWSVALAGAVHAGFSMLVWIVFSLIIHGSVPLTTLWVPVIFVPVFLFSLGCGWLLAGYSVFHPDTEHIVPVLLLLLMFLSPLFYSVETLPAKFHIVMDLNPLTYVFEQARRVMIAGKAPEFRVMGIGTLVSIGVAWLGLISFMGNREKFADAI